jgi:SAM-dependent methyltransferase
MHPKLKPTLKAVFRAVSRLLPSAMQLRLQSLAERVIFRFTADVHDLPPIFHYWSNRYLRPQFEAFGFSSPDTFFLAQLLALPKQAGTLRILALGSGRADLELSIARGLLAAGISDFQLLGIDLTEHTVRDARARAQGQNLSAYCHFLQSDLNTWETNQHFDVVLANHCLHHVVNLEGLFAQVKRCLTPGNGLFLVADMIGGNGHQLWPESLHEVRQFWRELPPEKRLDRATGKIEPEFVNYDCSKIGFEGIRAQDILPLLIERFEFALFLPYAGIVAPLIERRTGWNFSVDAPADLAFVDRLAAREQELLANLAIKPTQMLAAMRPELSPHADRTCVLLSPAFTPTACVRSPTELR